MSSESAVVSTETLGLVEVLRALPKKEFQSLITRVDAAVDPNKRIDVASQVARVLLQLPELKDPARLGQAAADLLVNVAEAGGMMNVTSAPSGLEPLLKHGLLFAKKAKSPKGSLTLVLPVALLLSLRSWSGDDLRSARALLGQASPEVGTAIAAHYLGRAVAPPLALALEEAWLSLTNRQRLAEDLDKLPPQEKKLLHAVEEVGGEVDTEELLEMEREPVRLRGASGATPSRRGVGFSLERRGFLIPVHPNRHIIPTEVAELVGAERLAEREALRGKIREQVFEEDYIPQRASFACDATPLAVGIAMGIHKGESEVRPGVGTPKSLLSKMSTRFGREVKSVALACTLSRVAGLWSESALDESSLPGSLTLEEVSDLLFSTWRKGGAWDESRPNGELLRVSGEARESGATGIVRSVVLEALRELGDGQWVPWGAISQYMATDPRTPGLARLIEKQAGKIGIELGDPVEIARRIATETLHVLGAVDLAEPDAGDDIEGPMLRMTPRGRAWLNDSKKSVAASQGKFVDNQTLRVGRQSLLSHVIALHPLTEVCSVENDLDLILTPRTLALAIGTGMDPNHLRQRLALIASLPDPIERQLTQASTVLGRAEFVASVGFLWIDDPEIRRMLSTRRSTADLFVNPSPPSGLLVTAGVDMDTLARRCRTMGIEVLEDGEVRYASGTLAPRRGRKSEPPTNRNKSGVQTKRNPSSRGAASKPASTKSSSTRRASTPSKPSGSFKMPSARPRKVGD